MARPWLGLVCSTTLRPRRGALVEALSGVARRPRCAAPELRRRASSRASLQAARHAEPRPRAASTRQAPRPRSPPSATRPDAAPIDTLFQQRKLPLVGASLAALCLGLYVSLLASSYLKGGPAAGPSCTCAHPSTGGPNGEPLAPTGRPPTVDAAAAQQEVSNGGGGGGGSSGGSEEARQSAAAFDRGLDVPERLMGITGLRKQIAARARGHVLEVAVGTGRNLAYYDWTEVVEAAGLEGTEEERARRRQAREKERVRQVLEQRRRSGKAGNREAGGEEEDETFRLEKAKRPGRLEGEVLSYTGVDISADMMSVARARLRDSVPGLKRLLRRRRAEPMPAGSGTVVEVLDGRVRLCIADAEEPLPSPPPLPPPPPPPPPPASGAADQRQAQARQARYDTIVQTFGLCSVADPARLLANLAAAVQPGTGRILLLEHGRGRWDWVNRLLDRYADPHFRRYGCWWNRDIEGVVREAARAVPGLEVVRLERPLLLQAGTTLLIELRVRADGERA